MAVYKDKVRGTWYVDVRYREGDKIKGKIKRGFETKREAQEAEWNIKKSIHNHEADTSQYTFKDVFDSYLSSRKLAYKSLNRYNRFYTLFLSNLKDKKLDRINDKVFLNVLVNIVKTNYSKTYKNGAIVFLRTLLNHSNDYFNTSFKPRILKTLSKDSNDIQERSVWTKEQFNEFIQYVENPVYYALFVFLFNTGTRIGEARAIMYSNITPTKRVKLTHQIRNNVEGLTTMKTSSSKRTIQLDDKTYNIIMSLQHSGEFVFGGTTPLSYSNILRAFNKALDNTNLPKIRIHDLRHSHATHLINNGANILAVSKRLGHSNTTMTLKVYAHLLEKTENELIELL